MHHRTSSVVGIVLLFYCATVVLVQATVGKCTHTSAGGSFYDLSPLSRCDNTGYVLSDDQGFVINVCNNVANTGCKGNVAVCQFNSYNVGDPSTASFSDFSGGDGVVLTYTGGDTNGCPNNAQRSTVFTVICDESSYPEPYINFINEAPACTYNFEIRTKYACPKNPAPQINECPINVFLVPHTHDDVGWLITVDQYYDQSVRSILSTVVSNLAENPERKFIYVEQAYFWRWWTDPKVTDEHRATFRKVYQNGQFEFVIGGWVMQDEACTTYGAGANQMELGHQFLYNTFGAQPTKGWQLDPFGASAVTPVLNKLAGFDAHLIDRITDKDYFIDNKLTQFIWKGSPSLGDKGAIFSEIMNGNTNAYCDWYFNFQYDTDPVNPSNVQSNADKFIQMAQGKAATTLTNNVLAAWGCDFQFTNATAMFHSMDQVVATLQQQQDTTHVYVKYATLSEYFSAVMKTPDVNWPVNDGKDFFPLLEGPYWTGYFSSRTVLKGQVRQGEAAAHAAEQIYALGRVLTKVDTDAAFKQLYSLRVANADAQHHDGVSGTSNPPVVQMYQDDINNGIAAALEASSNILGSLLKGPALSPKLDALLNLANGQTVAVVLYNSLSWTRNDIVTLPLNRNDITVKDSQNKAVQAQLNPAQFANAQGKWNLYFEVSIPPLGYTTYFVSVGSSDLTYKAEPRVLLHVNETDNSFSNDYVSVTIDSSTNLINGIENIVSSITLPIDQNLYQYSSVSGQSGAYAFTPTGPAAPVSSSPPKTIVTTGPIVNELFQVFATSQSNYASQAIRIYKSSQKNADICNFVEIAHQLGSLPNQVEVIGHFATNLATNRHFFSDSNGFEYIDRINDYPLNPIQANHYPSIYAAGLTDGKTQFTVISDRSHSVSSLSNGQFEVMLHRNPGSDGIGPSLVDTDVAYPVLRLVVDSVQSSKLPGRKQPLLLNFPVHPFVASATASWSYPTTGQLINELPPNVYLMSLNALSSNGTKAILRLTHLFAVGEHDVYSAPAAVNIGTLFRNVTVKSLVETTLTGNKVLVDPAPLQFQIQPKEIRTFIVGF